MNYILGTLAELQARLDHYYQNLKTVILQRQHPITGLLPASTAVNAHGDYTDAWVRDNVYSILAVWGLALAYRKLDDDRGRTHELEHSVVRLMRGLLAAMMRQSTKVEAFKHSRSPGDALHAKYDTTTGEVVVGDHEWGHLQLDATSLFLLMLAQMTASGLAIIHSYDEVNFIQNLTFYIGQTYHTPDYGIWERGNKINHGDPELNASSVGMAKAALEALNNFDLFGVRGSQASVIHVAPDDIARCRVTLESLLPRESSSKEVDAALLSVIGFPAYAMEDLELTTRTRLSVLSKLEGRYGCKRFLRDGHQTVLEDSQRLHYEPYELKQFEHIESEWPLFFTYLILDGLYRDDQQQAQTYRQKLKPLFVERDGVRLLPELYYVPKDKVELEKANPQSQERLPNENVPLVWAQSLYILGELLSEGLIAVGDVDPLGRRLCLGGRPEPLVQLALIAQNEDLQAQLASHGIATQTPKQIEPIQIWNANELARAYTQIGRNDRLGLQGRPVQRLHTLTTSRVFRMRGELAVFLPSFLDPQQFYLTFDYHFLVAQMKSEMAYIQHHWSQLGRPTVTLLITEAMLAVGRAALLELMLELQEGHCNGTRVRLGNLNELMLTASRERIDDLHEFEFRHSPVKSFLPPAPPLPSELEHTHPLNSLEEVALEREDSASALQSRLLASRNLYEQIDILDRLALLRGLGFSLMLPASASGERQGLVTVAELLDVVYERAGRWQLWAIVRRAAGLLQKVDISLTDAATDILVRQKQLTVGKAYSEDSLINRPLTQTEMMEKIRLFCSEDVREHVLTQEIIIFLSLLIRAEPFLFRDLLTIRVHYLIVLITTELSRTLQATPDEAYERMMQLSPFEIRQRLRQALAGYEGLDRSLFRQESLPVNLAGTFSPGKLRAIALPDQDEPSPPGGWLQERQREGILNRVPHQFYQKVWGVLQHCRGLIIGDKLERRNRLDSELLLSEMTAGETNFALWVEHLLNKVAAPEYRQLNVETLTTLAEIFHLNPQLRIEGYLTLDVLIGHAVRLAWLDQHPDHVNAYGDYRAQAWGHFYSLSPSRCRHGVMQALWFLIQLGQDASETNVESNVEANVEATAASQQHR